MARHGAAVTPSDTQNLPSGATYLSVAVAGNVQITTTGGETIVVYLPVGVWPVPAQRVWNTNTAATGIVAFWD